MKLSWVTNYSIKLCIYEKRSVQLGRDDLHGSPTTLDKFISTIMMTTFISNTQPRSGKKPRGRGENSLAFSKQKKNLLSL